MKAMKARAIDHVLHLGENDMAEKSFDRHALPEFGVGEQCPPTSAFRFAEKIEQAGANNYIRGPIHAKGISQEGNILGAMAEISVDVDRDVGTALEGEVIESAAGSAV